MARLLRRTPRYLSDARQFGALPKTQVSRDVRGAERALEGNATLPAPSDLLTYVPDRPDVTKRLLAYARRVQGRNLWIWFWPREDDVRLVAMTDVPPGTSD